MDTIGKILLLLLGVTTLYLLVRLWEKIAQKRMVGKSLPDELGLGYLNPEGVIFYFYHPKCGPCKSMTPILDALKKQYPDQVEKVNIADRQDLAITFGIRVTPTTVMVKNNYIITALIGYKSQKKLASLIDTSNPEAQSA